MIETHLKKKAAEYKEIIERIERLEIAEEELITRLKAKLRLSWGKLRRKTQNLPVPKIFFVFLLKAAFRGDRSVICVICVICGFSFLLSPGEARVIIG